VIARQLQALTTLLFRSWTRTAMRPGEAPKRGFPSTLILRVAAFAYLAPFVWRIGDQVVALGPLRAAGMRVALWGFALFGIATALTLLMPEMGRVRPPLRHPLLDELPVSPFPIMVMTWLQGFGYFFLGAVNVFALSPELRERPATVLYLIVFVLAMSLASSSVGMALVSLARATLPAHVRRALVWAQIGAMFGGIMAIMMSPNLGRHPLFIRHDPMVWVSSALVGEHRALTIMVLLFVGATALLATSLLELQGYDRIDTVSPKRITERLKGAFDIRRAERLLFLREHGRRGFLIVFLLAIGAVIGITRFAKRGTDEGEGFALGLGFNFVYLPGMLALQFASSMVKRDMTARPFLSAMPIAPFETLAGKAAALRRYVFPFAVLALPLAWLVAPRFGWWGVSWHVVAYLASLWLLCGAAPAVAFLSNGLGSPNVGAPASSGSFASWLLLSPLMLACFATSWFHAAVAVATMWAIHREAHRSALRCVTFIDDGGAVERDTAVWRALIVLATFFAVQGLIAAILLPLGAHLGEGYKFALIYGLSAITLALLTHSEREHMPKLRFWPTKPTANAWGVLAGIASGFGTIGLIKLLHHFGWSPPEDKTGAMHGGAILAMVVAAVIFAPLAEETFFRGWLQSAIAAEQPPQKRRLSILYGALAFAAVHVGTIYVPQFMLGLFAGALYYFTGGLLPGMIAHALHNAIALFLSGS
jgi:membrane protease YdiL (CAAX protease family)